jgi:hypothetical protein
MVLARKRNEIAIGYTYEKNNQFRYAINTPPDKRQNKNEHVQKVLVIDKGHTLFDLIHLIDYQLKVVRAKIS